VASSIPDAAELAWRAFCCKNCLAIPNTFSFKYRLLREFANAECGDSSKVRGGRLSARDAGKVASRLDLGSINRVVL
jgi:hypothetical protein